MEPVVMKCFFDAKYTEEDMRKCFEAGYALAAKHETNFPDSALPFEEWIKIYDGNNTQIIGTL